MAVDGRMHLASLRRTALLDTPPEPAFDRITKLVCRIVGSQTAILSFVDEDRQFFKSSCGLSGPAADARETPLSHSFCKYVVGSKKPFLVVDARKMPLLAGNGAIEDLGVISYLGAPVRAADGEVIGSLCAINSIAHDWTEDDLATLLELASIVEDAIALREQTHRALRLADENAVLAREYHHRVKNALAVSASLVRLSGKDAQSVAELVSITTGRLASLAAAHDTLITGTNDVSLQDLSERLLRPYTASATKADVGGPPVTVRHHQVTQICLILHELATNSSKYGALKNGDAVSLRWQLSDGRLVLEWREPLRDIGPRPEAGFGSKLLALAAQQLNGTIDAAYSEAGLTVLLNLPWPH